MSHPPRSLVYRSMCSAVAAQRSFVRGRAVPWGISESAYEGGYMAFGVPQLSLRPPETERLVVSTFLAPGHAIRNLRHMEDLGILGRSGFFEALDYAEGAAHVIRIWTAHHQGMSLLSTCNLLINNCFQHCFHSEPQVMAAELLLNERLPAAIVAEARRPSLSSASASSGSTG